MAKSLGTLVAGLVLDTSRWGPNFAKAGKETKAFVGTAGVANRALGSLSSSMLSVTAGAVSVGAVTQKLRQSFVDLGRTADLADSLGISVEAVQTLGLAAELSGTEVETLSSAMLKMNRTIGTGGMSLDKRFLEVATRLSQIEDSGKRAAEAFRIFGRRGEDILVMLSKGGPGLLQSASTLDRLGLVLSDSDVRKVTAANDALTELNAVLKGISNRLAVELSPAIKSWANNFVADIERIGKAMNAFGAGWGVGGKGGELWDLLTKGPMGGEWSVGKGKHLGGLPGSEFLQGPLAGPAKHLDRLRRMWQEGPGQLFGPTPFNPTLGPQGAGSTPGMEGGKQLRPPSVERHTLEAARLLQNMEGGDAMNTVSRNTWAMLRELQRVRENTDPARRPQRALVSL